MFYTLKEIPGMGTHIMAGGPNFKFQRSFTRLIINLILFVYLITLVEI